MDLIGSVRYIENSLADRNPSHGRKAPARKNHPADAGNEENAHAEAHHSPADHDTRIGQKIDTTA